MVSAVRQAIDYRVVQHTLLVQNEDIATVQVDGVGGTEARHWEVTSAEMPKETRGIASYIHRRPQ